MALNDTVVCWNCGQPAPKRESLGVNGAWLCGQCLKDQAALDKFLDAQMRSIRRVVAGAMSLAGRGQ